MPTRFWNRRVQLLMIVGGALVVALSSLAQAQTLRSGRPPGRSASSNGGRGLQGGGRMYSGRRSGSFRSHTGGRRRATSRSLGSRHTVISSRRHANRSRHTGGGYGFAGYVGHLAPLRSSMPYHYYPGWSWRGGYLNEYPRYNIGIGGTCYSVAGDHWDTDHALAILAHKLPDAKEVRRRETRELERLNEELAEFSEAELDDVPSTLAQDPPAEDRLTSREAKDISRYLAKGDGEFEQRDYDAAREEYVRALVLAGEDAGVRIALGLSEYALGSFADASQAIRRGVAIAPGLAESGFELQQAYGSAADFASHLVSLEIFVTENPEDVHAEFLVGFVRYFSGQTEKGLAAMLAYAGREGHDPDVRVFVDLAKAALDSKDGKLK